MTAKNKTLNPCYKNKKLIPLIGFPDGYEQTTLNEFAVKIKRWQKLYGAKAILVLNAGYNNIMADILPSKKQKKP